MGCFEPKARSQHMAQVCRSLRSARAAVVREGAPGQGLGTGEGGGAASWSEVTTQRNPVKVRSPQSPARSFLRDSGAASAARGLAGERDEQDDAAGEQAHRDPGRRSFQEQTREVGEDGPAAEGARGGSGFRVHRYASLDLRPNAGPLRFALRAAAVARTGTSEGRVPENSGEKVAIGDCVPGFTRAISGDP